MSFTSKVLLSRSVDTTATLTNNAFQDTNNKASVVGDGNRRRPCGEAVGLALTVMCMIQDVLHW